MTLMDDENKWLKGIRDGSGAELMYAEWLDEHGELGPRLTEEDQANGLGTWGHSAKAAFIRNQVALAELSEDAPDYPELLRQAEELLEKYDVPFKQPLLDTLRLERPSDLTVGYKNGLPHEIKTTIQAFTDHGDELMEEVPTIKAFKNNSALDAEDVAALGCPHVAELESLQLMFYEIPTDGIRAIVNSEHLGNLKCLRLPNNDLDAQCVAELVTARLPKLKELDLSWNNIGDTGAAALARSDSNLGNLEVLNLSQTGIGDFGARALANSDSFGTLKKLELDGTNISKDGLQALANGKFNKDMHITVMGIYDGRFEDFQRWELLQRRTNPNAGTGRGRAGTTVPRQAHPRDNNPDAGNEG